MIWQNIAPVTGLASAPRGGGTTGRAAVAALLIAGGLSACESLEGNITLGAIGATALAARTPTHEIEQIYYVGAFDPLGQLEPQMYRIRVHGQASPISQMSFASGWVRAEVVDSLGTTLAFDRQAGGVAVGNATAAETAPFLDGRKIFVFGPEGTRKVPEQHRLAIVMGASPEAFFKAIDSVLGTVAETTAEQHDSRLARELFEALVQVDAESQGLIEVQKDLALDVKPE